MTKNEIKELLGIADESFQFYLEMGAIHKLSGDKYKLSRKFRSKILEKGTVFKYSYEDSFWDDIKNFVNTVKYNGPVKQFNKKELEEYQKKKESK